MPKTRQPLPTPDYLMSHSQVALYLQIEESTLYNWRAAGRFPKPMKIGTSKNAPTRWRLSTVDDWLEQFDPERQCNLDATLGAERIAPDLDATLPG